MPLGAGKNLNSMLPVPRPIPGAERIAAPRGTDVVARCIALAALLMLLGIAGAIVPAILNEMAGRGPGPDPLLVAALLLNVALLLLGWRRYSELTDELADRCRAEEKARLLAETDALTGLLNRRSFSPATDRLFAQAAERGLAVAIVMLDLDNFKQVNDSNGHAAGDTLLIEAAQRISSMLPAGSLLARIGGDEFACAICYSPSRQDDIDILVEQISDVIARPVRFAGLELETTVSAGLAGHLPRSCEDALTVLNNADIAMYHAKKRGRNRHCWFDPVMEQELRRRGRIEAALRRGVAAEEFVPFFQQQVDLASGELTGFEMLARWQSEEFAHLGPDVFIPIAEEIGLIGALSEQLVRKALLAARDWDSRLTLAINISPCQLRDPWFAQKLLKLLVEANFPPSRIEIELTEDALADRFGTVHTTLASLKNQGVRITLDNFGTGHSSLSQLRSMPLDRVKIDRSLVSTIERNKESSAIIKSIASLGHGLGLPVTAEGIENGRILTKILGLGISCGQGYLYGPPQREADVRANLTTLALLIDTAPSQCDQPKPEHETPSQETRASARTA